MEFGELLKVFLLDLQSLFRSKVSAGSLTLPQALLLSIIPDDGVDMTTLAKRLGVDNSTATRLIDKIIQNGWAVREKSDADKRMTLILLTEKGELVQDEIEDRIDVLGEELNSAIPLEYREENKEVLSSLHWQVSKLRLKD